MLHTGLERIQPGKGAFGLSGPPRIFTDDLRQGTFMSSKEFVEYVSIAVEIIGVLLIVGGLLFATSRWMFGTKIQRLARYQRYREDLGRAILLGLEVLVAADIVRSVALDPTLASLGVLAMIVAVRTFLSWSLSVELEGQWPWQRGPARSERDPN
jgi:uncharacterized membrane protein